MTWSRTWSGAARRGPGGAAVRRRLPAHRRDAGLDRRPAHRADHRADPAPASHCGAVHHLVRHLPGRPVPGADRPGRLRARGPCAARRRRAGHGPAGDPRQDHPGLGPAAGLRGHGPRRRDGPVVGRVRGRERDALLRPAVGRGRADRSGQRRRAALGGRRPRRGRLHHLRPRGDPGAALPLRRPPGGDRDELPVRPYVPAHPLRRPHRRHADLQGHERLPQRHPRRRHAGLPRRGRAVPAHLEGPPGPGPLRHPDPGRRGGRARSARGPLPAGGPRHRAGTRTRLQIRADVTIVDPETLPRTTYKTPLLHVRQME